ncbi:MAG: patatin-like phospholipase family protein [Deltaproteobacteria bacterium]|nr:patatin-like phospholipase family protein [Deltaproteobacteria bacterium]
MFKMKILKLVTIFILIFALFSCGTTPEMKKKGEPKIALVLSGGSAKGFAHIGVIRVLEQEKIPIHMIVGTSVGSLIGGLYASNPDSFQLEWTAFKIEKSDILDFSLIYSKLGPVQGQKLENFVEREAKVKKIEETKIPFFPVATDLNTGETVVLEKGSLAKAVRASCAIPGIFVPVSFGGRTLVDGGVTNNIPCDIARSKGADIVIAVNLLSNITNYEVDSVIDIIGQSISIMMFEKNREKLKHADILIEPDVRNVSLFDFSKKKELMEEGIKAAKAQIPKIKELIKRLSGEI